MSLSDLQCRQARCPDGRRYVRLTDAGGLYLEVTATGSKLWRWKYRIGGKEKRLAFGVYPDVPLASRKTEGGVTIKGARELRDEARALLAAGHDPGEVKQEAKRARMVARDNAFEAVARQWWEQWKATKTERYAGYVIGRLEADVFPELGHRPVSELVALDFVRMVKQIEARGAAELARRSLQTCGAIMRYAVAHGLAERNPAVDVKPADVLRARVVTNFARVGVTELPDLLRKMAGYDGAAATRAALSLLALTFVRTSELIQARWEEFDLEHALWTVPADRTGRKGTAGKRRTHVVPLSRQAVEVLETMRLTRGAEWCVGDALLFRNERDPSRAMSNGAILMALKRMGYAGRMTGHGFRGVASTALNEMGYRSDVIEAQLSHVLVDRTRAAYNHAAYLDERRELMQAWADYLDAVRQSGKVIPFRQARAGAERAAA